MPLKKKCGIYQILNTRNGKRYIGSAVDIQQRWREHKSQLNNKIHHSKHLQRAWDKHGKDAFEFSIVETVEDENCLISREQYWLDTYQSYNRDKGYNVCRKAGSLLGFKHSEATKERLRFTTSNMSEEAREKIRQANTGRPGYWTGKKFSEEHRRRLSEARKGKRFSEEHRQNKALAQTGSKNHRAKLTEESVREIKRKISQGQSQYSIAKEFNVSRGTVNQIQKGLIWAHVI